MRLINFADLSDIDIRLSRGAATVEVPYAELERVILANVRNAAAPHGVEVKSASLTLMSRGPRALGFSVTIKAAKMVFSITVHVVGEVHVDDEQVLRVRKVECHGDGATGTIAAKLLEPEIQKHASKIFSLAAPPDAPVRITAVELSPGPPLRVLARFEDV